MSKPTIHAVKLESHFSILGNKPPECPTLSYGAKGLLWYLLSRPKDWVIYVDQLGSLYTGDKKGSGKDSVKGFIDELKEHGYVTYTKSHGSDGKWQHRYDVYPMPLTEFKEMFPEPVKPALVKPPVGNTPISPSKEVTKKGSNQEDDDKESSGFSDSVSGGNSPPEKLVPDKDIFYRSPMWSRLKPTEEEIQHVWQRMNEKPPCTREWERYCEKILLNHRSQAQNRDRDPSPGSASPPSPKKAAKRTQKPRKSKTEPPQYEYISEVENDFTEL